MNNQTLPTLTHGRLRIGTRGSGLARTQTGLIAERLRAAGLTVEVEVITTRGDTRVQCPPAAFSAPRPVCERTLNSANFASAC